MRSSWKLAIGVGVALCLTAGGPAHAAFITHIYELNGSFADSLGGPSLTPNGSITFGTFGTSTGLVFGKNQGPSLTNAALSLDNYSIEMTFRLDDTSGYKKLIDNTTLGLDSGLYIFNTALIHYPVSDPNHAGPPGAFANNVMANVIITRDGTTGVFVGYMNGVQQFSFNDTGGRALFGSPAHFFQDDSVSSRNEASPGFVDRIRVYDGALTAAQVADLQAGGAPPGLAPTTATPLPPTALAAALGVVGLIGWRRRR